jgi:hypothetical protein
LWIAADEDVPLRFDDLTHCPIGSLLQKLNRDTQKCAYKCSAIVVNGELRQVYKDPVTDKGKKSKKGLLTLQKTATGFETMMEGQGDAAKVSCRSCRSWWLASKVTIFGA